MILTRYPAASPPSWAADQARPKIRHLRAPRLPPTLRQIGWRLERTAYGWQCTHACGAATHVHQAAGIAIQECWRSAEPDHERLSKQARESRRAMKGVRRGN